MWKLHPQEIAIGENQTEVTQQVRLEGWKPRYSRERIDVVEGEFEGPSASRPLHFVILSLLLYQTSVSPMSSYEKRNTNW